jgi:Domain of unknown function (DUF222)
MIRRRPAAGAAVAGPAQMPEAVDEFAGQELGAVLGISAGDAEEMLDLSWQLAVNLPGTSAAFRAGILSRDKAAIMARATALLDPVEAREAEAMVLDQAGSLTPAALRAAIQRTVTAGPALADPASADPATAAPDHPTLPGPGPRGRAGRWPGSSRPASPAGPS